MIEQQGTLRTSSMCRLANLRETGEVLTAVSPEDVEMKILIGYASFHGSTREIAERIGHRLVSDGHEVDIRSLPDVNDPGQYDAYVLGSAIHNANWMPEAIRFVNDHYDRLKDKPVWLFSVGMQPSSPLTRRLPLRIPKAIADFQLSLQVLDQRVFGGVFRREHTSRKGDIILRAMLGRYGDYRDWDAIDHWAAGIASQLAPGNKRAA
jgi:menaquinone-dependent protoporphyrinogen oxidase